MPIFSRFASKLLPLISSEQDYYLAVISRSGTRGPLNVHFFGQMAEIDKNVAGEKCSRMGQ